MSLKEFLEEHKNYNMKTLQESIIGRKNSQTFYISISGIMIGQPTVIDHGRNTTVVEYIVNIKDFRRIQSGIDNKIVKQFSKFLDSALFEKRKSVKIKNITEEVLDQFGCNLEDNDSTYVIFNVFGDKYVSMNSVAHPNLYFPFSECKDYISVCIEDWLPKTKTGNIQIVYTVVKNKINSIEIDFI